MARRDQFKAPWANLYKLAGWRTLRRDQLRSEPCCVMCASLGITRAATVADHVIPHRGNTKLFFDRSNLTSLCKAHHDGAKQSWEKRGTPEVGADGWPIDVDHKPVAKGLRASPMSLDGDRSPVEGRRSGNPPIKAPPAAPLSTVPTRSR